MIKRHKLTRIIRTKLIAVIIAGMGILNVLSSLLFYSPARLEWLRNVIPTDITQGARGLNVVAGFFLIAIAWKLAERKKIAFTITNWLLVVSAVSHITKGLDFEEFFVSLALLVILWHFRDDFTVKSDPVSSKNLLFSIPYALIFFFIYSIAGFYFLKKQFIPPFDISLVFRDTINLATFQGNLYFTPLTKHARWFLESITLMSGVGIAFVFFSISRPVLQPVVSRKRDRLVVEDLLDGYGTSSIAYYALGFDKSYFFNKEDSCVIPYILKGNVALSAGDPIGPGGEIKKTLEEFSLFCEENQWVPAFYQAEEKFIKDYRAENFKILKIGEEALVDVQSFDTKGKKKAQLRQGINKGKKANWQFKFYDNVIRDEEIKSQLVEISKEWLAQKSGGEMGFTMGGTSVEGSSKTLVTVATDEEGKVMAFCTWAPMYASNGWSLDFMRRLPDAPNGVMEFLIAATIEKTKEMGSEVISLGMAPLSNVDESESEEIISLEKGLEFVSDKFNNVYHFKSLRHFKEKFDPRWENSYLIYPSIVHFPTIIQALIKAQMPNLGLSEIIKVIGTEKK